MDAALEDWRVASLEPKLRAMLAFIEKLTLTPQLVTASDARTLRASGLSASAIEDAIHVCTLFSVYDRLADTFHFHIPAPEGFEQSATMLLKRGYA